MTIPLPTPSLALLCPFLYCERKMFQKMTIERLPSNLSFFQLFRFPLGKNLKPLLGLRGAESWAMMTITFFAPSNSCSHESSVLLRHKLAESLGPSCNIPLWWNCGGAAIGTSSLGTSICLG
jgi:hypothetical protein